MIQEIALLHPNYFAQCAHTHHSHFSLITKSYSMSQYPDSRAQLPAGDGRQPYFRQERKYNDMIYNKSYSLEPQHVENPNDEVSNVVL